MSERIGDAFMEGTKYQNLERSAQQAGEPSPPLHSILRDGERRALPDPESVALGGAALRDVVGRRRSLRTYREGALSLDELSFLLWCCQGVKAESTEAHTFRTVPSAGARHAFETVLLVNRVNGLTPGPYQYAAAEHELIEWPAVEGIAEQLSDACLRQPMLQTSAATFIWVAERARMAWRYGERGIRYLFLDAGHVCQNLYLAAESIGAGACAIGAFDDDRIHDVLGLDGRERFVVYLASVGKR